MIVLIFLTVLFLVVCTVIGSSGSGSRHSHHSVPRSKRDYYGGEIPTPYEDDSDFNMADETAREAYLLAMEGDLDADDIDDFAERDLARDSFDDNMILREDREEW